MSDIVQAAKWMKEGCAVVSTRHPRGIYAQEETGHFFTEDDGIRIKLDIDDLTDTSWCLYEKEP